MGTFVKVEKTSDIRLNESISVRHDGHFIAIANNNGEFFAVSDICPHVGAPLGGGWVENGHIVCPFHYWRFELKTGKCPHIKDECIQTYNLKVDQDDILVEIPEKEG